MWSLANFAKTRTTTKTLATSTKLSYHTGTMVLEYRVVASLPLVATGMAIAERMCGHTIVTIVLLPMTENKKQTTACAHKYIERQCLRVQKPRLSEFGASHYCTIWYGPYQWYSIWYCNMAIEQQWQLWGRRLAGAATTTSSVARFDSLTLASPATAGTYASGRSGPRHAR
jgi:hypothetical protein